MKRLKKELSEQAYGKLQGVMWAFRKPWQNLSEEQQAALLLLFQHVPVLKDAYIHRETLTGIFTHDIDKAQAERQSDQWLAWINALVLACFAPFVITLNNWRDKVTNYFCGAKPAVSWKG